MSHQAIRIGNGFDAHAFEVGRALVVGGVSIPFERGLAGHSDGDPAVHALIDALLGALALPDIGQRFPSTDERWAGVDSLVMLANVVAELEQRGWETANADITIIAQAPRLGPFVPDMRSRLASALGVSPGRVGVKATTTDHLGAIGRAEGIAALAVVLLQRKGDLA